MIYFIKSSNAFEPQTIFTTIYSWHMVYGTCYSSKNFYWRSVVQWYKWPSSYSLTRWPSVKRHVRESQFIIVFSRIIIKQCIKMHLILKAAMSKFWNNNITKVWQAKCIRHRHPLFQCTIIKVNTVTANTSCTLMNCSMLSSSVGFQTFRLRPPLFAAVIANGASGNSNGKKRSASTISTSAPATTPQWQCCKFKFLPTETRKQHCSQ